MTTPKNKTVSVREYDFSGGARGKHLRRYRAGTNLVALSPDLRVAFPDSAAVNSALRELLKVAKKSLKAAS